jgi:hypothetical protein
MKNPLKDLTRPKALGLAGVAAGVLAISGGAAAMNVGLLSSGADEPFTPQPVSVTEQPTTTTTAAEPVIVYEDVYETVPAPTAPPAVAPVTPVAPAPSSGSAGYSDDDHGTEDHATYSDDDESESEHESEDADHEGSEDDGEDD